MFDRPQSVTRLVYEGEETERERTQEVHVEASTDAGRSYRSVLVQEYTFSPRGSTFQREDIRFDLHNLTQLRLTVVPIESLHWSTSGQVVIMTLLGGAGTFFGPFVGAGTFLVLEDLVSARTESWPLVIGLVFMAFVLFLPKGIWGTLTGNSAAPK